MRSAVLSFIAFLMLSGAASAAPNPGYDCFWANDMRTFRVRDSRTIDLQSVWGEIYRLNVAFCSGAYQARQIRFERSYVCAGDDLIIITPSNNGGFANRCWIQEIRKLN